mmetsp:Transcript_4530/g.8414  ORF Transcript_4530/g.8414 Transcript_4530/m.8414 type:complete len:150 (+) Transcript_4530:417-866(+)
MQLTQHESLVFCFYCMRVTTVSGENNGGYVDVQVDSGRGYVTVSTPGKYYNTSEVVLDRCFDKILGVQVKNENTDAWAGTIELSTDAKRTYSPFTCSNCNGTKNTTMPIVVEGDNNSIDQTSTRCHNGATCSIEVSFQEECVVIFIPFL